MKKYLLTGITSGIGKALFIELSSTYSLSGLYRDEQKKNNLMSQLKGTNHDFLKVDLNKPNLIEKCFENYNHSIDGIIYVAGIADNRPIKFSDYNYNLSMFNVNYFSLIEIVRVLTKRKLLNENSSSIVLSSIASVIGEKGKLTYSGSKGAIESSIRSISKELYYLNKSRFNVIRAGMVDTQILQTYLSQLGEEFSKDILKKQYMGIIPINQVLNMVKFLLSEESILINGSTLNLDGGWLS